MKIKIEFRCISKSRCVLSTIPLFILAGLFEIGGVYMFWLWLRESKEFIFVFFGVVAMCLYGIVPTFQPSRFHRVHATYGGIFAVLALLWGWIFDKTPPDIYDTMGILAILIGAAIIFYWPRKDDVA
ncbi:small multidrug resistance family-3 protein [Methanohalophilus levihalophilus]|uniref:YnfA family protein n=1 Tax=Methanohalophilus levihalophilus TaxID=1431282 RepID=UPI001AEAA51F|nr:YnfA family protein [Methanohalophilus levihalophilus]MBP2030812.1 small multidrug resistance family-3 protein [Methanohalophilus levihalophilus]